MRLVPVALAAIVVACGAPAEPASPPPPSRDGLSLETFLLRFPGAFCDFLTTCKNDGVEVAVSFQMGLTSLAPAMKDKSFGDRWERQMAPRGDKKHYRWRPTQEECTAEVSLLAEGYSLTAASLKPRIGKTMRYDAAAAARCLEATKKPLPVCQQTKVAAPDANEAELDKLIADSAPQYADHLDACTKVLVGLMPAGQPCEDEFDCEGVATCFEHVCKAR